MSGKTILYTKKELPPRARSAKLRERGISALDYSRQRGTLSGQLSALWAQAEHDRTLRDLLKSQIGEQSKAITDINLNNTNISNKVEGMEYSVMSRDNVATLCAEIFGTSSDG